MLPFEGFGQQNATAAAAPPKQPQARAPKTQSFGADVFKPGKTTTLRWLGGEGFMVNARGTTLMIDPLLEGFDIKVMIEEPILPAQVPHLNAVLDHSQRLRSLQRADVQRPPFVLSNVWLDAVCRASHDS